MGSLPNIASTKLASCNSSFALCTSQSGGLKSTTPRPWNGENLWAMSYDVSADLFKSRFLEGSATASTYAWMDSKRMNILKCFLFSPGPSHSKTDPANRPSTLLIPGQVTITSIHDNAWLEIATAVEGGFHGLWKIPGFAILVQKASPSTGGSPTLSFSLLYVVGRSSLLTWWLQNATKPKVKPPHTQQLLAPKLEAHLPNASGSHESVAVSLPWGFQNVYRPTMSLQTKSVFQWFCFKCCSHDKSSEWESIKAAREFWILISTIPSSHSAKLILRLPPSASNATLFRKRLGKWDQSSAPLSFGSRVNERVPLDSKSVETDQTICQLLLESHLNDMVLAEDYQIISDLPQISLNITRLREN